MGQDVQVVGDQDSGSVSKGTRSKAVDQLLADVGIDGGELEK